MSDSGQTLRDPCVDCGRFACQGHQTVKWRTMTDKQQEVKRCNEEEARKWGARLRDLAVQFVDNSCGYTMEFANSPAQHRSTYDWVEDQLNELTAAVRGEVERLTAEHEDIATANIKRITELGLAYDDNGKVWRNARAEAAECELRSLRDSLAAANRV